MTAASAPLVEVLCGKALDVMPSLPAGTFDLVYLDPPFFTDRDFGEFDDRWESISEYIDVLIRPLAVAAHRALTDRGNFVLHLDWHAAHYAKVACDDVFGFDRFQNEIIWGYASGGGSTKHLSRKHDTLLCYSKTDTRVFNVLREPYATPNVEGRPGFHPDGRMMTDVWTDIPFLSTTAKERTGYPTQKPVKLLTRVVSLFSTPDSHVLDMCCGSGTTGVAASGLGRRCVLIDKNPAAVAIAHSRLGLFA